MIYSQNSHFLASPNACDSSNLARVCSTPSSVFLSTSGSACTHLLTNARCDGFSGAAACSRLPGRLSAVPGRALCGRAEAAEVGRAEAAAVLVSVRADIGRVDEGEAGGLGASETAETPCPATIGGDTCLPPASSGCSSGRAGQLTPVDSINGSAAFRS